ncbi:universal stress protein [Roseovarius aestuariivivens]|uniref:universal stress protein n=1 Tax=Roseovarius aestuariivivens TaxID=1888910 RepID=UPI0014367776|nr:universal stress protein [Roseovarius aestuariivivens]
MFKHIMVPVDMAHEENMDRAAKAAADLAKLYDAKLTFVSISGGPLSGKEHSSKSEPQLLEDYAKSQAEEHGVAIDTHTLDSHDVSVEVDRKLLEAIEKMGSDLVVMATHQPGWLDYLVNSHGGRLASHAPISVMVVRNPG